MAGGHNFETLLTSTVRLTDHFRNGVDVICGIDNLVEDDWDKCFNMNVKSGLWLMHAAMKHLDETEGAFITTASVAGVGVSGSSLVMQFLISQNNKH